MSLLVEPMTLEQICEALAPEFKNRHSIHNALREMRRFGRMEIINDYRTNGGRAIWQAKAEPTASALDTAWPYGVMPARLPGIDRARHVKGVCCD